MPIKTKRLIKSFIPKLPIRLFCLRKASIFPFQMNIEGTSFCNARCIHCEHSRLKRPYAHMEMDLYKRIINECHEFKRYCKSITFQGIGEPFLDPTFFEKVKYVKQKNPFLFQFVAMEAC